MTDEEGPAEEPRYDTTSSSQWIPDQFYRPLALLSDSPPITTIRPIAGRILDALSSDHKPWKEWRAAKRLTANWKDAHGKDRSVEFRFDEFVESLRRNRKLSAPFDFRWGYNWLDKSVVFFPSFQAPQVNGPGALTFDLSPPIANLPLSPKLDREGIAFSSLQLHLQQVILTTRDALVRSSLGILSGDRNWIVGLFNYANSSIALFDNTVMQIYYKAKFDPSDLGVAIKAECIEGAMSKRFMERVCWLGKVTGRPFNDAPAEMQALRNMKELRNHLNHMDPPFFAASIEDIAGWLNLIHPLARLHQKIRDRIGAALSVTLAEMLIAPTVVWVARDPGKPRPPQPADVGYGSCRLTSRQAAGGSQVKPATSRPNSLQVKPPEGL